MSMWDSYETFGRAMRRGGYTQEVANRIYAKRRQERKEAAERERKALAEEKRKRQLEEVQRRQAALERSIQELAKLEAQAAPGIARRPRTPYRLIEQRACDVFGVTPKEIKGERRNRDICLARQFVMYWAARLTSLSYPAIGRLMGNRDHTTVLHGRKAYVAKRAKMGRTLRAVR